MSMLLTIENTKHKDFGTYACIARNSLGEVRSSVQLQGQCLHPYWLAEEHASLNSQYTLGGVTDKAVALSMIFIGVFSTVHYVYAKTKNRKVQIGGFTFSKLLNNISGFMGCLVKGRININ